MAVVWIPSLLQTLTDGRDTVTVPGRTVRQVLRNLAERYPGMRERVFREDEEVQEGIAIAVDGEVVTLGMFSPVGETSEVHILPAIGGGAFVGDVSS